MEKEIQPVAKDPLAVFDAMEEARKSGDVPAFLHHVQILDQMLLPASGEFPEGIRATEVPGIRDHLRLLGKTPAIWNGAYGSLEEAVREGNPAAVLERARLVEVLGIPDEAPRVGDYILKLREKYAKPAEEPPPNQLEQLMQPNLAAAPPVLETLPDPFSDLKPTGQDRLAAETTQKPAVSTTDKGSPTNDQMEKAPTGFVDPESLVPGETLVVDLTSINGGKEPVTFIGERDPGEYGLKYPDGYTTYYTASDVKKYLHREVSTEQSAVQADRQALEQTATQQLERYRARANEVGVKVPQGDFMPVDGRKIRSFLDEEGSTIPSHIDPEEVEKRLPLVGQYGGNDGAITFIGPDGRYWVGLQSEANFRALETAGYQQGSVGNIMNADCKFADPELQEQWEQWEAKLYAEQQAKSLIPPEKREGDVVSEEISGTTTATVASLTPVIDTPLDIAKRTDKTEPVEPTTPETKLITSIEQLQLGDRVQMVEPDGRRHPPFIVTITEARNKSVHGIDPLNNKSRFASLNWTKHLEKVPFSPGEAIPVVVVGQVTAGDRLRVTRPDGKIKEWTVGRVGSHGSMFIQPEESGQVGIDLNFLHGTRVEKIPAPS